MWIVDDTTARAKVRESFLLEILEQVIRRAGAARPRTGIGAAQVLEPGIVSLRVQQRGGSTFLMDSDVGVFQYIRPAMSDDDARPVF